MKSRGWFLWLACLLTVQPVLAGDDPRLVVADFHGALLTAMQSGLADRQDTIGKAVDNYFDVYTISRISLGRNWRGLGEEDQQHYQGRISKLIKTTYVSRFDGFDEQEFADVGQQAIAANRQKVSTTLTTKKEIVSLDYMLLNADGEWRIYDVVANGVSDLSLKRSNYAAIFKEGGLEAVVADIDKEIVENTAEKAE